MKYVFPANYGEDCVLVPIDAALVPFISAALMKFQERGVWATFNDYTLGYNAFAELQADMAGRCVERLILEIRALRGGSSLAENWRDPEADPAQLGLSTIGGLVLEEARTGDGVQDVLAKLEEIRLLIEAGGNSEEILEQLGQIAVLLA